jgi:hypothetical protein
MESNNGLEPDIGGEPSSSGKEQARRMAVQGQRAKNRLAAEIKIEGRPQPIAGSHGHVPR